MFVLFDCLPFQTTNSRHRGIGRYCANLLAGLAARPGWDVRLLVHGYLPTPDEDLTAGLPGYTFHPPLKYDWPHRDVNEQYLGDWVSALKPDWVLHPSVFEVDGYVPRYSAGRPKVAAVMYDLIPLLFHHVYGVGAPGSEWYARRLRSTADADLLLAISASTAADTRRLFGPGCPPVVNVRGAADPSFHPAPEPAYTAAERQVRERYGLDRPFVLFVGGFDPRKNMFGAIAGYAALPAEVRAECDLVLACKLLACEVEQLAAEARRLGVEGQVKITGFVPDADLRVLYQACRVFFFPSFYEGLGLPIVEAMRYGAPVVTADNSSLPEYAGPASWYCDPASPESMAEALATALAEPRSDRLADRLDFANAFTWEDTVDRSARAVEEFRPAEEPRKVRVAWVAPAPPQNTGIADYAVEVADALSPRFEIEWVLDADAPPPDAGVARRFPVVRADEVEARHTARPFDLFVYHVGNNYFHTYMLPLMRRHPGLVMVHDLNLGGLYRLSRDQGVWPGAVADELAYNGEWLLEDWVRFGWVNPTAASIMSPLSRRVAESAAGVVVHSRYAWQQVRRLTDAPVAVVPHIATPPAVGTRGEERRRLGLPGDKFVVATLGHVGPHKRIPSLLQACGALPEDVRSRTHVLIVGPLTDAERERFHALAKDAGVPGQLEIRGKVPLADFPAYALAADVCVQLRYPFNGETSGALTRAMAAGACCVTSDMPTMAEVPNSASIKVRTPACEVEDLTAALTKLARDPELRDRLGANAKRYMAETHGPGVIAARYAAAVENAIAAQQAADGRWLADALNAIADVPGGAPDALIDQWAKLRGRVLRPAVPAEALPELPEVPSEARTGKQAA